MASFLHSWSFFNFSIMALLVTIFATTISGSVIVYKPGPWALAHATFYGDETASATMGTLSFYYLNCITCNARGIKYKDFAYSMSHSLC